MVGTEMAFDRKPDFNYDFNQVLSVTVAQQTAQMTTFSPKRFQLNVTISKQ